jgi:hypothetical protein
MTPLLLLLLSLFPHNRKRSSSGRIENLTIRAYPKMPTGETIAMEEDSINLLLPRKLHHHDLFFPITPYGETTGMVSHEKDGRN